ncbi:uncharacterized protein LOC107480082 [Arachis duranensis]|uniref:Uncharacterized protein LOC107480082 n=1 Tax=Arachis duranensis TaxID=130453 RepID=A0A6P4CWN6_ARADU|nr:uncharacterized protein LOC107480082 [Arachis duranensis]
MGARQDFISSTLPFNKEQCIADLQEQHTNMTNFNANENRMIKKHNDSTQSREYIQGTQLTMTESIISNATNDGITEVSSHAYSRMTPATPTSGIVRRKQPSKVQSGNNEEYWHMGDASYACENYHALSCLIPPEGSILKFAELYVFDTNNEIQNRMSVISCEEKRIVHEEIVRALKNMLDEHNVLVKVFRMVRQFIAAEPRSKVKLRLMGKRGKDGRRYNLSSANEIAALIVGDFDPDKNDRDIVVETQSGRLQRIN